MPHRRKLYIALKYSTISQSQILTQTKQLSDLLFQDKKKKKCKPWLQSPRLQENKVPDDGI